LQLEGKIADQPHELGSEGNRSEHRHHRKRKEEEKGLGKKFTFGKKVFSSEVDVSTSESACALMCLVNSTTSLGWVGKKGMSGTDSENGKNGKIQTRGDQEPFHRCCLLSCK